jgi:SAM-dependent methyltransferase
MPTRQRALTYPRRDLTLGFCPSCGFVANSIFDPTVHEYSSSCEETQGFSPTFNAFSRRLASRWVEQYGLKGKRVLEIGCGKGEFLAQMVEAGVAGGIGIDPAYVPGRLSTPATSNIRFIQDFYGEQYRDLSADVICCRHTLEHIAPTHEFLQTLRATIGNRADTLILFELPDFQRVLDEAAFWDIYYEHCSYFTSDSLARLFRSTGFELLELELVFNRQYIVLAARPSSPSAALLQRDENDLEAFTGSVSRFSKMAVKLRQHWLEVLNRRSTQGQKIVIWGGGSKAVSFITTLGLADQIDHVVDVNPHKHNKFIPGSGHAVRDPAGLEQARPDCIILMNPIYEDEVQGMLQRMNLSPEIVVV